MLSTDPRLREYKKLFSYSLTTFAGGYVRYTKLALAIGCLTFAQTEHLMAAPLAPPPATVTVSGQTSENKNNVYAGLKWTFGQGFVPEAVLGYRHAKINSGGDTDGGDLSLSFRFAGGFQVGQVLRAKYFNGKQDLQGEASGGYDFSKAALGRTGH